MSLRNALTQFWVGTVESHFHFAWRVGAVGVLRRLVTFTEANNMPMKRTQARNIDAYIAACPQDVQAKLQELRAIIRKAAPEAEETINYAIPTFTLNGNLVHFAAFKNHIGFYPAPSGITAFKKELSGYAQAKGSVQFPLDQPLPLKLITRIVKFRVKENLAKAKKK
jgi:uncharacterized protein YdhG (YjbR/CyaY superfamily)